MKKHLSSNVGIGRKATNSCLLPVFSPFSVKLSLSTMVNVALGSEEVAVRSKSTDVEKRLKDTAIENKTNNFRSIARSKIPLLVFQKSLIFV